MFDSHPRLVPRRRVLLKGCVSIVAGSALGVPFANLVRANEGPEGEWPTFLGAWKAGDKNYAGTWHPRWGARGVQLDFRVHDVVPDPNRRGSALAVGRRPGQYIVQFDVSEGTELKRQQAETYRIFNGHAVFSHDGNTLYTAEHDQVSGDGIVSVRDARTLIKHREWPSHGIAPHAMLLQADGTLLVANGGIQSIPEVGEKAPDLARMYPSLAHVDPKDGRLLGRWTLKDRFLSIRHMVADGTGNVGIALQAAHPDQASRDLAPVFVLFDGKKLSVIDRPFGLKVDGYAGDIASVHTSTGHQFALGCTHAGLIAWWSPSGHWQGTTALTRACAMASNDKAMFALTDKKQAVSLEMPAGTVSQEISTDLEWENHVRIIS